MCFDFDIHIHVTNSGNELEFRFIIQAVCCWKKIKLRVEQKYAVHHKLNNQNFKVLQFLTIVCNTVKFHKHKL